MNKSITNKLTTYAALAVALFAALLMLFGVATPAHAGVGLGVSPNFPSPVTVGDTGLNANLSITNNSDGGDGDPVELTNVTLIPSCGDNSGTTCDVPDPGVFTVSNGVGANACAGINFTTSVVDVTTGKVEFAPDATVELALDETCEIDYTIDVVGPIDEDSSVAAGLQTKQVAEAEAIEVGQQLLDGGGFGTDTTTVQDPSTDVSADLDLNTVVEGGSVTLMVSETNDGDTPLANVYIYVDPLGNTYDQDSPEFTGTDDGDDGILSPGEIWEWEIDDSPTGDTTYTVTGHGDTLSGDDVTWCEDTQNPPADTICDQDERDSDSVRVVEGLIIRKTADTSYDREWDWEITKTADPDSLELAEGEAPVEVGYVVEVDTTGYTDINHVVTGTITVTNPAGNPAAEVTGITDVLDESGTVSSLECEDEDQDNTAPWTLSPGEVLNCTYEQASADPDDSLNTVTVETDVASLVPGGQATADVEWGDPENEIDECIVVNDTNSAGPQDEEVCAGDAPESFNYSISFGNHQDADVFLECGEHEYPNTASYVVVDDDNDTGETGSVDENVLINIDCFEGCTLTQGYWKTHSDYGPAPYDENWINVEDNEEDTIFFLSDASWYETFWTPPSGGNPYYQLAHQWMAAALNVMNGASTPAEVDEALAEGESLFEAYGPDDLVTYDKVNKKGKSVGKKTIVDEEAWDAMKDYASVLASYNEGDIGPGHCDMDDYSNVD